MEALLYKETSKRCHNRHNSVSCMDIIQKPQERRAEVM